MWIYDLIFFKHDTIYRFESNLHSLNEIHIVTTVGTQKHTFIVVKVSCVLMCTVPDEIFQDETKHR